MHFMELSSAKTCSKQRLRSPSWVSFTSWKRSQTGEEKLHFATVDLIKSSGDVPISVVSTRGNNIPSNWDELNVIPLAAGDWARLFLEEAFTNKPRDDSAFWMVEFPQGSTEDEIRQFFSTIPLGRGLVIGQYMI